MAVKLTRQKPVVERSRVGATRRKPTDPDFESVFDDGDEDMFAGVEMTGELQEDADTRMSEALRQIIERKKATQERFRVATDPDFYSVICFQSREQRDDFLTKAGWREFGTAFLNGLDVARQMNIPIEIVPIEPLKLRGKPKKFSPADILQKGE